LYVTPSNTLYSLSPHQLYTVGTIHWSVSKSALDSDITYSKLTALRKRSNLPYFLPTRVGIRKMERVWHSLQFNPVAPVEVPFKAQLFRRPPKHVQVLRQLSRKGRKYLRLATRKQKGRPKLVLGLPNDARDVAPLVALAHRTGSVGVNRRSRDKEGSNYKTAVNLPAESAGLQGPHKFSSVEVANVVSENQETTQKVCGSSDHRR